MSLKSDFAKDFAKFLKKSAEDDMKKKILAVKGEASVSYGRTTDFWEGRKGELVDAGVPRDIANRLIAQRSKYPKPKPVVYESIKTTDKGLEATLYIIMQQPDGNESPLWKGLDEGVPATTFPKGSPPFPLIAGKTRFRNNTLDVFKSVTYQRTKYGVRLYRYREGQIRPAQAGHNLTQAVLKQILHELEDKFAKEGYTITGTFGPI